MNPRIDPFAPLATLARRRVLCASGALLSAGAVALLAGRPALAAEHDKGGGDPQSDVAILNAALAAEHQAVAAYGVAAGSGLLQKAVLDVARQFQGHHKAHADVLAGTVRKLGGDPVEAKSSYDFPTATLKTQNDVLGLAAALERGAVTAYLGAVPMFRDRDLARAAASILGDEAMHWAVLRHALGDDPVPGAFV